MAMENYRPLPAAPISCKGMKICANRQTEPRFSYLWPVANHIENQQKAAKYLVVAANFTTFVKRIVT